MFAYFYPGIWYIWYICWWRLRYPYVSFRPPSYKLWELAHLLVGWRCLGLRGATVLWLLGHYAQPVRLWGHLRDPHELGLQLVVFTASRVFLPFIFLLTLIVTVLFIFFLLLLLSFLLLLASNKTNRNSYYHNRADIKNYYTYISIRQSMWSEVMQGGRSRVGHLSRWTDSSCPFHGNCMKMSRRERVCQWVCQCVSEFSRWSVHVSVQWQHIA